jgi:Zn-dependent hydrolases, including glyoxylases
MNTMLNQVADGVWVRQSAWVWSNAIAVRGEGGLILVDPGIDGSELNQLADDLDRLGLPVVAGFSTHPHWDHLLWHPRFGDVPRYATPAGAHAASEARERGQRWRRRARRASLSSCSGSSPRCPRTADPCRARSSSIRRTPSATPRSSSRTVASCSPATCSPTS